jgi:hypothetical protein
MGDWAFKSYRSPAGGDDELRLWYDQQVASVQAEFVTIAQYLRLLPAEEWERPDYADLTKKQKLLGYGEIRLKVQVGGEQQHHRILGYRDVDSMVFVALFAARKSAKFSYDQAGIVARKAAVLTNPGSLLIDANWIFTL